MGIGHRDQDVLVIDAIWEARPPFSALDVVKGHADALKEWGLSSVMGDDYGAGLVRNMFAKQGIAYQSCPLTASQLYLHSRPAWTSGMVRMLDVQRAIEQLCALRRKVGQGGQESVVHLGKNHDDVGNIIAGILFRLTPLEQAGNIAELQGIGVVKEPRVHIGDPGVESETWQAWQRTQNYARAPDGGLGRGNPSRGGNGGYVW